MLGVLIIRILLFRVLYWDPLFLETPRTKMWDEVGRIKDPLYEDSYLGISHLPSSHLLRPPTKPQTVRKLPSGSQVCQVLAGLSWEQGSDLQQL